MFRQLLTPVADSLSLSFLVAILPVLTVLVLLGVVRRPAWQASLAGLAVGLILAVAVWSLPVHLAANAVLNGVVFALWPVMWIVVNALLLYNIAVEFRTLRRLPLLDSRPFAERPAYRARRDRFLLRGAARRHCGLRHSDRNHVLAPDPGRVSGARGFGLRVDLQYRARRIRGARRSRHGARRGNRTRLRERWAPWSGGSCRSSPSSCRFT